MFVDSHCHLEMEDFDKDRENVIERALAGGVRHMLTVGTDESYFDKVIQIIETYPSIHAAIGIHPHNAKDYSPAVETRIKNLLSHDKIVGYGEIGLDFFRNHSPRDKQINAFEKQVVAAQEARLPVIIHSRDAKDETIMIVKSLIGKSPNGVIHCYSYDNAAARQFLDMGFYISFPGTITYKNAQQLSDVVRYVPSDRILAETDAPFLTPHPFRGKRNEPSYVRLTTERIAGIKGIPVEEIGFSIHENFMRAFPKIKGEYR